MGILNIFKKGKGKDSKVLDIAEEALKEILDRAGFDLSYELQYDGEVQVSIELQGEDETLLKAKGGVLLNSIQFLVERILQHNHENKKLNVTIDSNQFNQEVNSSLTRSADRLKKKVLNENRSYLFKPLDPRKRRVIHQHLSEDKRVTTKSVGDGYYKKIKISINTKQENAT